MKTKCDPLYEFHVGQPSPYEDGVRDTADKIRERQRQPAYAPQLVRSVAEQFLVAIGSFALLGIMTYATFWAIAGRPFPLWW
jgi:hypothetical protein